MGVYLLYNPTESSHVDATTLITHDAAIYEGDFDGDSTLGDDPLGAETDIFASGGTDPGTSLGFGHAPLGSGANTKRVNSLFRITLPEGPKTTASGEVIRDSNTTITKIVLKFKVKSLSGSPGTTGRVSFSPLVRPPALIDYSAVTYNTMDGSNSWSTAGAMTENDRDGSTDFKSVALGVLVDQIIVTDWNEIVLQDTTQTGPASPKTLGLNWGQTVDILGFSRTGSSYQNNNTYARVFGLEAAAANKPYLEVHYEDDAPSKAEITASPDPIDLNNALISFTKRPEDEDLQQFVAVHRSDGTDPTYVTTASSPNFGIAITDTGKEIYRGFDDLRNGGIASTNYFPGTSSTAGSTNKLAFFTEDNNNTGASGSVKSNVVSVKRYLPYTEEDFGDSDFAKSCSVNWIIIGKATSGTSSATLIDNTSGTDTPWLRGQFLKNNVEVGDKVWNDDDGVYATITGVTNTTIAGTLSSSGDWNTNDVYQIIRRVDVGEKVTLTVRSTLVDGLKFDRIGVNWTNTTAASAIEDTPITSIADYDIIELDSAATEHTVSFRYSTPGTYYPSFFFVDSTTGFRTALAQMGRTTGATGTDRLDAANAKLVVEQPVPIPRLTSSKSVGESANVALDRGSAVVYSGANSSSGGSDAFVKEWRWLGEPQAGQILTQGCLDIDNTPLIDESKKLFLRCNTAGYNATVFTIYGLASFEADNATSVKDTATTFSHYRYVKATVSAGTEKYLKHDTVDAFATAAVVSGTSNQVFFKQVDFIYATTKSGTSGSLEVFQLLAADSDNDGTIDAAGTLDINTVCKRLCIDSNNSSAYKWGGLITVTGSSNITFTKNSGADTITGVDWIGAGFGPGDTITIESSSNDGVYTIQKLETTSGPVHTLFLNEELPVAESNTSATIFTSQPAISVASSAAGSAKISLNVVDNLSGAGAAAVNIYTTFRDQTSLDLNALADTGNIAIQNASLTRAGGISAAMPLGERRYPPNAVHTRHGLPKMSMTIRVIDDTGFNRMYRLLNNSYNYAIYQHHDTTFTSWVKYRLKVESFTVNRDPQNLQHQVINLSFFVVGEEV